MMLPETQTTTAPVAPPMEPRREHKTSAPGSSQIYGSFLIDQSEIALPVAAIREVVNEPEDISLLPLAPDYLLGLFNLRGMIIPIIDLRILLEFPDWSGDPNRMVERKVAIIENGNQCVGILFDRAGEVLNEPNSRRVDFAAKGDGVKDVVIDGVLKLEDGKRLVQILDPYELLQLERVPRAAAGGLGDQSGDLGSRRSCMSFQLGHTWCAFDLRHVQEVSYMLPVERSLLAHGCVIGTANLRGEIIPIVDFRSYLGDEEAFRLPAETLARRKLIVVRTTGGLVGLMVYSIDSIMTFFDRDILPFAKLALPHGDFVKGCLVSEQGQLVMLLDNETLLSDPRLSEPAAKCQEVYHPAAEAEATQVADKAKTAERRTFILFTAASNFAMDSCAVSEVINRPEKLLKPPYALSFVDGIINLRGELITLVNLRRLYGLEASQSDSEKVVIFFHKGRKYAILVDSVDEIVMTTSEKIMPDAVTGFTDEMKSASVDVSGALSVDRSEGERSLVMIMSAKALVSRFAEASAAETGHREVDVL